MGWEPPTTRLVEHDRALAGLLESLLAEVPAHDETPVVADAPSTPELNTAPEQPLPEQKELPTPDPIPEWAATAFRVLLFRIGGYRFALPLVLMRSVAPIDSEPTRLPGRPSWQLGIMSSRGQSVMLVELGGLTGIEARCQALRYALVIGDGDLAVACDEVEQAVLVENIGVRWSARRSERAWLAGLLVDQMCLLLDGEALASGIRHG